MCNFVHGLFIFFVFFFLGSSLETNIHHVHIHSNDTDERYALLFFEKEKKKKTVWCGNVPYRLTCDIMLRVH